MSTYPHTVDVAALRRECNGARDAAALATSAMAEARSEAMGLAGQLERCQRDAATIIAAMTEDHRREMGALTESHHVAHASDAETIRQLRADVERLSAERRVLAGDLARSRAAHEDQTFRSSALSAALGRLRRAVGEAPGPFVPAEIIEPPGDRFRAQLWPRVDSWSTIEAMKRIDATDRALIEKARAEFTRAVACIRAHEAFVEEVSTL